LGVALALCCAGAQAKEAEPKNVIVIGWDGTQRNHLKEMVGRNEVPALMALAKEGKLIDIDVTNGATDTKAGWTQILTGCRAEKTGVFSNGRYKPIPEGMSVFERLEKHFGPRKIDTVAIIGKKAHVDADAPKTVPFDEWEKRMSKQKKVNKAKPGRGNLDGGTIVEENGKKFVAVPGKPWFNAKNHMDLFRNGLKENDAVATLAMSELEKRKDRRFFFFIHFAQPDHAGHAHGENSQEYTDAIKSDDESTSRILAKLKELGLYEKTLVYVVADHGFDEGAMGHSYAPYVTLATNDPKVSRDGDRMDIAPTVLKRFGVNLKELKPALDGTPLDEPAERKVAPAKKPAAARGVKARKAGGPARAGKADKATTVPVAPAASEAGSTTTL
jgi:predicted AlkP superfamily phosphohydrolase/phosphomutase